jgi:hypothetical protein
MNSIIVRASQKQIQESLGIHYCSFGCGRTATYFSNRKKWRCELSANGCPKKRENHSNKMTGLLKGSKNGQFGKPSFFRGKKRSEETIKKMSAWQSNGKSPCIGRKHSKEELEKMSKSMSEFLSKKCSSPGGKFRNLKFYKSKNILGQEFLIQGTWELKVSEFLNRNNILWTRGRRIPYVLKNITKHYIPDFYLPDSNKYIEVKGWFQEKDQIKMAAVLAQNSIDLTMIFEKDMKNLESFFANLLKEKPDRGLEEPSIRQG